MAASLSITTPAYEAEACIAQAVASVLAQGRTDWEMVIASDDGRDYLEILKAQGIEDPRVRVVATGGQGTGAAQARNRALAAARGRVVVSLDADDLLQAGALEVIVPLALDHGAAYSDVALVDFASGRPLRNCNRPSPRGLQSLEGVLTGNLHTFAWIAIDRERLPGVRWPDGIARWEDVLFFAACGDALGHLYYTPEPLYVYRRREGSVCNRPQAAAEYREAAEWILRALDEDRLPLALSAGTRAVLRRYFRSRCRLEALCERALAAGTFADYQEFLRANLDQFYRLE
jgi:glycosyltransferase involved in cell wall biosynthesis